VHPTDLGGPPPPGWYPDPSGEKAWRWWDGVRWTEHASDPSSPEPYEHGSALVAGTYPGPWSSPSQLQAGQYLAAEERSGPWARRAFCLYLAVVVLMLIGAWAQRSQLRDLFHMFRVEIDTGVRQPTNRTAGFSGFTSLALLVEIPFYVLTLVWQYRAARAARCMGLIARHSPGLGVGSWFIPIVNFWFPYQALRDCFPAGHPGRRTVVRLWTFFIIVLVTNLSCTVLAVAASPGVFLVGAGVSVVAGGGFSLAGVRLVQQVAEAHRRLLTPQQPAA
jgi:hypothetical protein